MSEKMSYPVSPDAAEKKEAMTPTEIRLVAGNTEVVVSPDKGGLVSEFSVDGENILYEDDENYNDPSKMKLKGGIPVLFPYAGPREGGVQHGGAREVPVWTLVDATENSTTLSLDSENIKNIQLQSMVPGESVGAFEGRDASGKDIVETLESLYGKGYRFQLEMKLTVSEGTLRYDFKIKNLSDKAMPFSPGLHPYFKADHDKRDMIKTNLDNFDVSIPELNKHTQQTERPEGGTVSFTLPDGLGVDIDSSPEFHRFVGWAENDDRDYICIEPFVANPREPEADEISIQPLETKELFVEFKVNKPE